MTDWKKVNERVSLVHNLYTVHEFFLAAEDGVGSLVNQSKQKQHGQCIRDGCSIHQKHRGDVSGQLYWRKQPRLKFKFY